MDFLSYFQLIWFASLFLLGDDVRSGLQDLSGAGNAWISC